MRLSNSDLEGALSFLQEAEAVTGSEPFPAVLLERMRGLVPCEIVNFCELDRPRERLIADTYSSGERFEHEPESEGQRAFWRLRHQHPICAYHDRTGDFSARRFSDFVTRRELRRLELYTEFLRPAGVEFQLVGGLRAPPWHTKVFLFHRDRGDFGERDRSLLDLLLPHLAALYENAKARRLATLLAAGAETGCELVVLDSRDRVEFATARARRLLRNYCDERRGARLPKLVEDWLDHDRGRLNGDSFPPPRQPLTIERGDHRLLVARTSSDDHALLLIEQYARSNGSVPLSWREWEVLALVEEGKTNHEIAATLWISPGTVRKHLENIYGKLGVHSRTAAVTHVRESQKATNGRSAP